MLLSFVDPVPRLGSLGVKDTYVQPCSLGRYNRQGRKANRRSRDSYSNTAHSRTQTVRNTGTHNLPLYLTRATIRTNDRDTLVYIGDLSPRQHRTARSSCQEVSTTTIHRPLTLDQRHAEFPMCTSQEGTFSHRWPAGCSHPADSVQVTDQGTAVWL